MGLDGRASRLAGTRSTSSSSAAARTRASATCARRRPCSRGARCADGVRMLVVPGSQAVKRQAEAEGLDRVFTDAGAEWREAGCSMCIAMNGDQLSPGQYAVSTSNRNFEGRQGEGGRTFLASPAHRGRRRRHRARRRRARADLKENARWNAWTSSPRRRVVLPVDNVDTDQIIPARFLKATGKGGLGSKLFADWRFDADGKPKPDFSSTAPTRGRADPGRGRQLRLRLVARARALGAGRLRFSRRRRTSIADIFRNNALKNGFFPVEVDAAAHAKLLAAPGANITISVEGPDRDAARRRQSELPDRPVRPVLLAAGRGRAGVPAVARKGNISLRRTAESVIS